LLPITQDVLREAARLRALHTPLKSPDAIHAATALVHGCALFLTNDLGFRSITGLPLAILDEVIAAP
jgi:predicted nucleic acid-binding protein